MSVSDGINIICAIVTLITTIIIAELQFRQGQRMEEFEKRQDKRDEKRHAEEVKSRAVSFYFKTLFGQGFNTIMRHSSYA